MMWLVVVSADETLQRLGPERPRDWAYVPKELQTMLQQYPLTQSREMKKGPRGRFVAVRANHHGMGNRLNAVLGAFALALVTDRGLAIQWEPASENCKKKSTVNNGVVDRDCDPVGLTDLYELPFRFVHNNGTKCKKSILKGDREMHKFDALLRAEDLKDLAGDDNVICAESDRPFGWAVTCNRADLFPDPWNAYGLLQDYLLRPVKRIRQKLRNVVTDDDDDDDDRPKCAMGLHLRKERYAEKLLPQINATMTAILADPTRYPPPAKVFLASDPFSLDVADKIVTILKSRGFELLEAEKFEDRVTRMTINGLLDAVVDHSILSSCDFLLPMQIERSTFHDTALARLIWRRHLHQDIIRSFINRTVDLHNAPPNIPDTRLPPPLAACYFPTYLIEEGARIKHRFHPRDRSALLSPTTGV